MKRVLALSAFVLTASAGPGEIIGHIRPRAASEIVSSPWSVGCETLDRDFAVYTNYSRFVGPLGAKAARLQAGWAKCEKVRGRYDFAWLDLVVDDLRGQGVQPWLELSYGNPLYPGGGGTGLGAGLIASEEALHAWDAWVRATVRHFRDRVNQWEVWNEPDINVSNRPAAFAPFYLRTATIVRAEQTNAQLWALGLAGHTKFLEGFLQAVADAKRLDLIDAVTVHGYPADPDDVSLVLKARAIAARFDPRIAIRQGETGAPSTAGTFGALAGRPWSEFTQARWDLRRLLAHRGIEAPMNLFTLMELQYPGRLNTKGLLRANADGTVAAEKPAYRAAQHVFAIFDDTVVRATNLVASFGTTQQVNVAVYLKQPAAAPIIAFWASGAPPTESTATIPVEVRLAGATFREPVLVDLLTGSLRGIEGTDRFSEIPLSETPQLIAERSAVLR